jgi:hypothetical protein
VECGMGSVGCGVWDVECGMWSVGCGVWDVEWDVECERWREECATRNKSKVQRYIKSRNGEECKNARRAVRRVRYECYFIPRNQ